MNAANVVFLHTRSNSEEPKGKKYYFGKCKFYAAMHLHCLSSNDILGLFFFN